MKPPWVRRHIILEIGWNAKLVRIPGLQQRCPQGRAGRGLSRRLASVPAGLLPAATGHYGPDPVDRGRVPPLPERQLPEAIAEAELSADPLPGAAADRAAGGDPADVYRRGPQLYFGGDQNDDTVDIDGHLKGFCARKKQGVDWLEYHSHENSQAGIHCFHGLDTPDWHNPIRYELDRRPGFLRYFI